MSTSGTPSTAARLSVLLAEDNFPDALLVREAIRTQGLPLDVHLVPDGQAAIEFIERAEQNPQAPRPDFLLLDLNLPKRDGFEVLRRLRASPKFQNTPVLVITSSDSPQDLKQSEEFGARYFRKTPSYEEFLKLGGVLRRLLNEFGLL